MFNEIKKLYKKMRNIEKCKIIKYFHSKGWKVPTGCKGDGNDVMLNKIESYGCGKSKYSGNKKLKVPADLSNFMWIYVEKEKKKYIILLQAFEKDEYTKNQHIIYDRLQVFPNRIPKCTDEMNDKKNITNIDLPVDEKKLKDLEKFICNLK